MTIWEALGILAEHGLLIKVTNEGYLYETDPFAAVMSGSYHYDAEKNKLYHVFTEGEIILAAKDLQEN